MKDLMFTSWLQHHTEEVEKVKKITESNVRLATAYVTDAWHTKGVMFVKTYYEELKEKEPLVILTDHGYIIASFMEYVEVGKQDVTENNFKQNAWVVGRIKEIMAYFAATARDLLDNAATDAYIDEDFDCEE